MPTANCQQLLIPAPGSINFRPIGGNPTMSSTIALILVMIWALTRPDARQL